MTKVTTETDDMPDDMGGQSEPTLQGLLDELTGGKNSGWGDLDARNIGELLKKQIDMNRQKMRAEALQFRACFATEAGRKVLEQLLGQTLRRTAWPVHAMTSPEMLMAYGIWREAENAFVAAIVETIAFANNAEVKPRSEP